MAEAKECMEWCQEQLALTLNFWITHSQDFDNGGYYNCLSENGEVYDTTKYGWLQGRQVWMLSKLYNDMPCYRSPRILDIAIKGGEFLLSAIKVPDENRCYFSVTKAGKPLSLQRKPYTECFYIMGLAELFKASNTQKYLIAAQEMLEQLIYWIRVDDSGLGMVRLSGAISTRELGRPMMLLNVLTEFCGNDQELRKKYSEHFEWSIEMLLLHYDGQWIREHVLTDGTGFPEGSQGRLTTPGHAIEAGWFLLKEANKKFDKRLRHIAITNFIQLQLENGWDKKHGGLFYFLDVGGHCPTQLEWCNKLWWVHCEAMVALLMVYHTTRDYKDWLQFKRIYDYTAKHFPDSSKNGEWYGYLDRQGNVTHTFKGGPYKGFFHVARCLYLCDQMLQDIQAGP